jgi:hypothetical protein
MNMIQTFDIIDLVFVIVYLATILMVTLGTSNNVTPSHYLKKITLVLVMLQNL